MTPIISQVQEAYNGLGQLIGEYQSHGGAVNTSTTPEVQYLYASLSGASSDGRPTGIIYPSTSSATGRQLDYKYDGSTLDDSISRIDRIYDHSGDGAGNLEGYGYLGLSTIVTRTRGNNTALTYAPTTVPGGDGGDQYTGLDRFGRVDDQYWLNTSTSATVDRFQYAYDRDGNVVYRNNLVNSSFSELYAAANGTAANSQYDALNRLKGFARGALSAGTTGGPLDTVSTASRTQGWTLDAVGNWTGFNDSSTSNQSRNFDARNEITSITGGGAAYTPTFDANGNMTMDETGKQFVYDAWNRIVTVKDHGGSTLETFTYDALGRRVTTTVGSTTTDLYYSTDGNVIEERQSAAVTAQQVWGLGYVNDLVLRDCHYGGSSANYGTSSSGLNERLYAQQDANWNVTALIDTSGAVKERLVYTPYGVATVIDGTTNWSTTTDSYSWVYTWQGGRLDSTTAQIHFGDPGRDYSPGLGRWGQPDVGDVNTSVSVPALSGVGAVGIPSVSRSQVVLLTSRRAASIVKTQSELVEAGYIDGADRYQMEISNPVRYRDPSGRGFFSDPTRAWTTIWGLIGGLAGAIIGGVTTGGLGIIPGFAYGAGYGAGFGLITWPFWERYFGKPAPPPCPAPPPATQPTMPYWDGYELDVNGPHAGHERGVRLNDDGSVSYGAWLPVGKQ